MKLFTISLLSILLLPSANASLIPQSASANQELIRLVNELDDQWVKGYVEFSDHTKTDAAYLSPRGGHFTLKLPENKDLLNVSFEYAGNTIICHKPSDHPDHLEQQPERFLSWIRVRTDPVDSNKKVTCYFWDFKLDS